MLLCELIFISSKFFKVVPPSKLEIWTLLMAPEVIANAEPVTSAYETYKPVEEETTWPEDCMAPSLNP
jgi:hypothetical protein